MLELSVPRGFAFRASLLMQRIGAHDPTAQLSDHRFAKAARTPEGPVTLELVHDPEAATVSAQAWGEGSSWALSRAAAYVGASDDTSALSEATGDMATLLRRCPGLLLVRSPFPQEVHAAFVLQQRITYREAVVSHHRLVDRFGEDAPGPLGLRMFPDARTLARVPSYTFRELNIDAQRARALLEATRVGERVQKLAAPPFEAARKYLLAISGTGVWTAENVMGFGFGDPDAVPLGDVHLPHTVSWALARERWSSDERMLELLSPFRGQRFRVLRLLALGP